VNRPVPESPNQWSVMLISAAVAIGCVYLFGHWLAGVSVIALMLIWRILRRPGDEGPPVLALALTTQWLQVTAGIFYMGLTGRMLSGIDGAEFEPMVLIGLGCVLALAGGLWAGARLVSQRMAKPENAPEELVGWRLLLMAYAGALVTTGVLQQLAFAYATLTQALLALSYAHLAILFLILRRLTRPTLHPGLILLFLAFEVALGFTGYFSNFKEPLLLAGLAMLETFEPRRVQHWATAAALAIVLAVASVMWMGVRTEFRQDIDQQWLGSSRSTRLERMQALLTDWLRQRDDRAQGDLDVLVARAWAIYYPALAVERVPAVLPHTDGELLRASLLHLVTPRLLFPNKPDLPSDSDMVRKYSGVFVAGIEQNTSIAFGYAAESYVDFGVPLMFVPVLVFGIFCGAMYEWFMRTIQHRELALSLVTVIFWLNLYLFERSWAKTLGLSITMMVYLGGLSFLLDRWLLMRLAQQQMPLAEPQVPRQLPAVADTQAAAYGAPRN